MENVRIAIRDSTDSHNVAFFDNISGIRYQSANLQRFLAGSASILTIEYNSKDIDTIRTGCKLAFIYKQRAYWLNIMDLSKKGYKVEITAYSLGLELNQEERGAHKPANAMSFTEYLAYYDPEHALELGVNEVADKRIKLEWTGTDTILARLFSIANSFDAELEFTVELNQDYSLKRQVLNVYKKGNLGSNRAVSPVRVGRGLKVINYSDNLKELRTAVRATGKDGLTLDGLNKKVYDDDGNLLYYSNANTVYAPQSRDKYPSVGKKSNDNWIIKELGETEYSTQEDLWGYMLRELKKICVPEITYDIEGAVDGDVGDTRTLIDDVHYDPPLYVQARISELTEDLITGKVTKSTLTNFERKYSQVASELLKQVEQLANDAAPYIIRLETNNGFNFKNGKGSSTVTASLEKYGKIVGASWQWIINNSVVSDKQSATINASQVTGTLNVVAVASVDGNEVAREYITFTNSDDGVGIKSIKRYYTTNDQAEGVTAGGQNWSTKPTTVTADKNYMWSYDVITYTNDTSLVTEPAVIGARGDDGLDADTTGITEALDKAKQELTALSANIEKVRDDSLAAVEEAKQQLAAVANDLSKAKTDLQNAVSAVDTKATNLQSDLTTAKQDLQAQASQLTEQASAQSELTKRVSSVEETANGTKTTVSELSKTVDSNTKNITSVTARTKVVEDDLTSTKTTLSQVQTTANSASQKTATLETGLNGLGAKFENLQIGTVNLLHNSKGPFKPNANKVDNWQRFEDTYVYLENGKQYVLSGETDGNFTSIHDSFKESDNVVLWLVNPNTSFNKIMSDGKTGTTGTVFTWNSASGTYQLRVNTYRTVSTKSAWNIQIEEGNLRSTYSQNESDIESKVAEYKQTADQNYASLSSTVQTLDGQVQSNKTTAEQTAQGFSTRIESLETYKDGETTRANQYFELAKTETARQLTAERTAIAKDYVAKSTYTSDVTGIRNDLTATTTTANTTKTNLANYQASNDKAVANLQSNLQTANGNISSLQTKVEAVPGQITSAVSAVEGKIPTSAGGRNLAQGTSKDWSKLFTEFSGIENAWVDLYKVITDGLVVGDTFKTRIVLKYTDIKPASGKTAKIWIQGAGNVTAWNSGTYPSGGGGSRSLSGSGETVFELTDKINADHLKNDYWSLTFRTDWIASGSLQWKLAKVERGMFFTDWSPAPEDTVSQISSLSSQIKQTADGMTLLATKTELNTAKSELQSGISTATSKADNAQATANSNAQTISTHTTQISALNTGLQAKVSKSDFDSLSGRVTTAENNITVKANELSSKITSVEGKIPKNVGGANLFKGSRDFSGSWENRSTGIYAEDYKDVKIYKTQDMWMGRSQYFEVKTGEEYVFSAYVKSSAKTDGILFFLPHESKQPMATGLVGFDSANSQDAVNFDLTDEYQRIAIKIKITKDGWIMPRLERYNSDAYLFFGGYKLERGNIPTDWSPAPEDYDSKLASAQSEIKQTTDSITASVSSVQTAASNAQSTANTAVSKADAAQAGVNTLDNTTVKTATLNLDNNGFVTKVGKTVNGNTFATMIAQNESDVQIIAKKMKVSGDMIVNGAITAEKLNVSNLSAVNSNLGKIEGGSLLLQENKAASSSIDSWGTFNRPAHKQGLYMDNHGLASSGAIQRKNSGETMPTDMPLAVLQSGELRFLVVDYNDNLENVLHYGLSDPDFGAIRFEIDSELKRRLTMMSSGYLNFQATNYTNWTSTGVNGCEYMIQGRLVLVNYDVTFNSAGTHTIGGIPQEFTKKSLMMTAKAWTITPRDKNIQLNSDGTLHILDAEANVNYRGTLVFSY
ncbi:Chromosome partition protein Smc [Streptococcus infantarius subsp. infantarius]|nr:Chromosome partition protein Smc [Streptococcus infantarius subsp. infantarius]